MSNKKLLVAASGVILLAAIAGVILYHQSVQDESDEPDYISDKIKRIKAGFDSITENVGNSLRERKEKAFHSGLIEQDEFGVFL